MFDKIPSPPTDNLYKLSTFLGLVLVIAGFAGPWYSLNVHLVSAEKGFTTDFDAVSGRLKEMLDRAEQKASETQQGKQLNEASGQLRAAQMELTQARIIVQKQTADTIAIYSQVARQAGFFWLSVSLLLWYFRHQRHQDAIVRNEALSSELERDKLRLEVEKLRREVGEPPAEPCKLLGPFSRLTAGR